MYRIKARTDFKYVYIKIYQEMSNSGSKFFYENGQQDHADYKSAKKV